MTSQKPVLTRRQVLVRSASSLALAGGGIVAKPYLSRAADRPQISGGIQSGDVDAGSAIVWARADRPARMHVECSTVGSFKTIFSAASADALPDRDFTAKLLLENLPAGQDAFYRVWFEDFASGVAGESRVGHFRTAPRDNQSISFVWSGDTAGQGWGIDVGRGGYRTYHTMRDNRPDFFIHSGDHIYADCTDTRHASASERRDLAQHRHRGKIRGRPQSRAVSRQLQIQLARREFSRLPRRSACPGAMGRP